MNWTPAQQKALLHAIQRRNEWAVLKRQLDQTITDIDSRQEELAVLGQQWQDEQADVDQLHRLSWASVWYDLLNRKEQQISKEEAEVQQARLRCDAVSATISALKKQQVIQRRKLTDYSKANDDYEGLIGEKQIALSNAFSKAGRQYQDYVADLTNENQHLQELNEAHAAGMKAFDEVKTLVDLLNQAGTWGMWDIFGGSAISSAVKYGKLDDVRNQSHRVTRRLTRFRSEYADLNKKFLADWKFDDKTTRFVDIFFDNIFTDLSVQKRILAALKTAEALEDQLIVTLVALETQQELAIEQTNQKADELQRFLETV